MNNRLNSISINFIIRSLSAAVLLILLGLSLPQNELLAQTQSGAAFLKILPGARQQGLSGSLTGVIDEPNSIYANPAAVGFYRPWQWSASYTEWIADIFNASMIYGKQLPWATPWSDRIMFAVGLNYQGIREFDSSRGADAPVSARDILVSVSFGTPVSAFKNMISFGVNIKYFRSQLANFSADAFAFDVGFIARTPRFRLSGPGSGFLNYGILSGGIAINHLGQSMKFSTVSTPLPRTLNIGVALSLGSHDGFQIQISGDYKKVRDEKRRFSFGAEITNLLSPVSRNLGRFIDMRGGYNFDNDLLSKLSLGVSIRLDDYMASPLKSLVPRNSAMRMDFAVIESNEFFTPVYRGSVTHYSIQPETFELLGPLSQHFGSDDPKILKWQGSKDPDLYDETNYVLIVTKGDKTGLEDLINKIKANKTDIFEVVGRSNLAGILGSTNVSLLMLTPQHSNGTKTNSHFVHFDIMKNGTNPIENKNNKISYKLPANLDSGDYFWATMAYDKNEHYRFAEIKGNNILHFQVEPGPGIGPDLTISITHQTVEFDSAPDDSTFKIQKMAHITFKNVGNRIAEDFAVHVYESELTAGILRDKLTNGALFYKITAKNGHKLPDFMQIVRMVKTPRLKPGEEITFLVPCNDLRPSLVAIIDESNEVAEVDEENNFDIRPITKDGAYGIVINFKFRDATLSVAAMDTLAKIAKAFIKKNVVYEVVGHASLEPVAPAEMQWQYCINLELSKNRAWNTRNVLLSLGVPAENLILKAFGHKVPWFDNDTEGGRIKNRRVEIRPLQKSNLQLKNCD